MKHKHSRLPSAASRPAGRVGLGLFGSMIICFGLVTLATGKLHYPNWWEGPVFAPFATIVGTIAVDAAIRGKPFKAK